MNDESTDEVFSAPKEEHALIWKNLSSIGSKDVRVKRPGLLQIPFAIPLVDKLAGIKTSSMTYSRKAVNAIVTVRNLFSAILETFDLVTKQHQRRKQRGFIARTL